MVGIFSRFSVGRAIGNHRRSQSAIEERGALPQNVVIPTTTASAAAAHGIESMIDFKPVEHPVEPFDNGQPVTCPLPEPSILNDGRLWKERISATTQRSSLPLSSEATEPRTRPPQSNRLILPSVSAPEHNLVNLLEECNPSGI